jgi:hypothetical protein
MGRQNLSTSLATNCHRDISGRPAPRRRLSAERLKILSAADPRPRPPPEVNRPGHWRNPRSAAMKPARLEPLISAILDLTMAVTGGLERFCPEAGTAARGFGSPVGPRECTWRAQGALFSDAQTTSRAGISFQELQGESVTAARGPTRVRPPDATLVDTAEPRLLDGSRRGVH